MRIRQDNHFRREAITLFEAVDITTYDRVGKRGTDALATLATTGESGEFLFEESGAEGDVVRVAYLSGSGGQVQLKLSGTGSAGSHLVPSTNGVIVASGTDSGEELQTGELGVALQDWVDGDSVECDIFRI